MSTYTVGEENKIFEAKILLEKKRRILSLIDRAVPADAPEQQEKMDCVFYEWGEIEIGVDSFSRIVFSLVETDKDDYLNIGFTDIAPDRTQKKEWDDCNLSLSDEKIIAFIKKFWEDYAPKRSG